MASVGILKNYNFKVTSTTTTTTCSDEETVSYDGSMSGSECSESEYNTVLYDVIKSLRSVKHPYTLDNPGKVDPKFYSKRRQLINERAKSLPIPPCFNPISTIIDREMNNGCILVTPNQASKIYRALTKIFFFTTEEALVRHTKLLFVQQIHRDYFKAKKQSKNRIEYEYSDVLHKAANALNEPWTDRDWLLASKAFFAPIHIRNHCTRVPLLPHVKRYAFSPAVIDEYPIRLVLENGSARSGDPICK